MRLRPLRTCLFAAAAALASSLSPSSAEAGGAVVPRVGTSDPSALDVRMAVAVGGAGTTRWTEVTTSAPTHALWLVPARPGAAIDWAPDGWLAALDDATAVRVLPPSAAPSCTMPWSPERAAPWANTATKRPPGTVVVHATADAVRAYAAEHGYDVTPAIGARIAGLYEAGWNLVSIELTSTWSASSTGTLRVSDDGGAVLPLALTGSRASSTRVTAFTIGAGVASLPGARDVDARAIRWGSRGSTYAAWRRNVVEGSGGATWLRESASHAAIFEGTPVQGAIPALSVAASYFVNDVCTSSAQAAGGSAGTLGIACAPGAAARVPGGSACTPSSGTIDPASVTCGSADDLALALSATAPSSAVVTRWAGLVPPNALGADLPITFDPAAAPRRLVVEAAAYEPCTPSGTDPPLTPPSGAPSSSSSGGGGSSGGGAGSSSGGVYVTDTGCGGSTTTASTTVYEEDVEESDPPASDATSDSCSGGTETTSSSSDGWDSDDSGDGCSGDDSTSSSSSSSDSCSGGSSSSSSSSGGSDDGWDTEDEMSPKAKKPHAKHTAKKKRGSSPVSRYALLVVALLLPLRRRGRER